MRRVVSLLLIVPHHISELVIICGDEVDIALVHDRGRRRLQRVVSSASASVLFSAGIFLSAWTRAICALVTASLPIILLGHRIETRKDNRNVVDDIGVFVIAGKAIL